MDVKREYLLLNYIEKEQKHLRVKELKNLYLKTVRAIAIIQTQSINF
jgi:hypothetical protein